MHSVLSSILAGIAADDQEAFIGAGELLRAHRIGVDGTAVIEPYGSKYSAEPLTDDDVDALRGALLEYLDTVEGRYAGAAVHALGELYDETLIPVLRDHLLARMQRLMIESNVVGQLIVGLNNLGEGLFDRTFSAADLNKNIADARRYLEKCGRSVGW